MHGEDGSDAGRRLDLERPAVAAQDVLHDRKAQPRAARLTGASLVGAVKAFRESRNVLGLDPDPRVGDGKDRTHAASPPAHRDCAAVGGVAHGVGDEVHRGASQFVGVTEKQHVLDFLYEGVSAERKRFALPHDVLGDAVHRDDFGFVRLRFVAVFEPREHEKIVDDVAHALHPPRTLQ